MPDVRKFGKISNFLEKLETRKVSSDGFLVQEDQLTKSIKKNKKLEYFLIVYCL